MMNTTQLTPQATTITYGNGETVLVDAEIGEMIQDMEMRTVNGVVCVEFYPPMSHEGQWVPLMVYVWETYTMDMVKQKRIEPINGEMRDCRFTNLRAVNLPKKMRDGRKFSLEEKKQMFALRQSGMKAKEVALQFGCCVQYVHDVVCAMQRKERAS